MLGNGTVFGRVVWTMLPNLVRGALYPYYAMAPFCLGVAVLAGIGLDQIKPLSTRLKYVTALLVAADLIMVGSGRPMNIVDVKREPGITRVKIDGSTATLLHLRQLTNGQPPARIDTHESSIAFSTTAPLTQIPTANGYNPLVLERLIQARLSFAKGYRWGAWYEVENMASPMIDALNIRYLFTSKPIPAVVNGTPRYSLTAEFPGFFVYENLSVLPRFWVVHQIKLARTPQEAFTSIHRPDFRPATVAVVEELKPPERNVGVRLLERDTESVERFRMDDISVRRYDAREVVVAVRTKTPGFLATSEVHYPGWHGWLDGSEVPIFMTNGAFRGVALPSGDHIVKFRFMPRILYLGAGISAFSLLLTVFVCPIKRGV